MTRNTNATHVSADVCRKVHDALQQALCLMSNQGLLVASALDVVVTKTDTVTGSMISEQVQFVVKNGEYGVTVDDIIFRMTEYQYGSGKEPKDLRVVKEEYEPQE